VFRCLLKEAFTIVDENFLLGLDEFRCPKHHSDLPVKANVSYTHVWSFVGVVCEAKQITKQLRIKEALMLAF
jgi:hypothetical protein